MRYGPVLRRLTVHRYRHVAPETTVEFGPDSNLLLGRNGTGKSTLLSLARAVHDLDFRGLEGDEFDLSARLERDVVWMEVRVSCSRADGGAGWMVGWRVEYAGAENDRFSASQQGGDLSISVAAEAPTIYPVAPVVSPPWLRHLLLHQVVRLNPAAMPFWMSTFDPVSVVDEALDTYEWMKKFRFRHVQRHHNQIGTDGHQIPYTLLAGLGPAVQTSERDLTITGVAFTDAAAKWMGFARADVQFRELSAQGLEGDRERAFGDLRCVFERADGTRVADDQLSFGQKRLLAFLYAVECSRVAVYADELVNGFHHEWIGGSLEVLSDGIPEEWGQPPGVQRQSVLTSQNPLLVDAIGFSSADDMARRIVVCRTELRDGRESMVWENLSAANAGRLWVSKEVGLQSVSELLRTQGLW